MKNKIYIIILLCLGFLFGQSDLGRIDGQLKMQNQMIDAFDDSTRSLVMIDLGHSKIHDGESFIYTYGDADFDQGDTIIVAFVTPNSAEHIHFVGSVGNSSEARVYFLEAPTITAIKGTNVDTYNRNRASTDTSSVLSSRDSTEAKVTLLISGAGAGDLTNLGITLETYVIGSGKNKIAGATRDFNEWVLNEYVLYAFMVIGLASDGVLDLRINWYEHIPGEN